MTNKHPELNDTGLIDWLWENSHLVAQIEKILKQKRDKDTTIRRIRALIDSKHNTSKE